MRKKSLFFTDHQKIGGGNLLLQTRKCKKQKKKELIVSFLIGPEVTDTRWYMNEM